MGTKILVAGLSLGIRARLQGKLKDVTIDSVRTAEQLSINLAKNEYVALVINEPILDRPVLDYLEVLSELFHGVIIFCASGHHSANNLRMLVRRYQVAAILQHPIQPDELVRSLVVQVGLQMTSGVDSQAHLDHVQMDEIWAKNRLAVEERIQAIENAKGLSHDAEGLKTGLRAAHLLAGSLGSFGFQHATLIARQAEAYLQSVLKGESINSDKIDQLVVALRTQLKTKRTSEPHKWGDHVLVAYSQDTELLQKIETEALLNHWTVQSCAELEELTNCISKCSGEAAFIDLGAVDSVAAAPILDELGQDEFPTTILTDSPQSWPVMAGFHYIDRTTGGPFIAYQVVLNSMRSQLLPVSMRPPAILVVDDDKILLKVMTNMLTKADFYVQALNSPLEFWDSLEQMNPELIILDVDIPPLGGIELCGALRCDERYKAIPVMFVSSYNDADTLQRCFAAGADDYLYKPLSSLELITRVANRLERTRQVSIHARGSVETVYAQASINQMLLRALREDTPACLVRLEIRNCVEGGADPGDGSVALAASTAIDPQAQAYANRVQRSLRKALRIDDVIKPLSPLQILIGMSGVEQDFAAKRVKKIVPDPPDGIELIYGFAMFPKQGTDLERLIDLANPRADS